MFVFLFCGVLNALNFYLLSSSLALANYYIPLYFFITQGALAWLWIDFTLAPFEQLPGQKSQLQSKVPVAPTALFQGDPAHQSEY